MHWEIHPPRPSRFPSGGDFAPLGPRDCPRASPSGNLSGLGVQNPRPREISRASGDVFPNTSLLSAVYGYNTRSMTFNSLMTLCKHRLDSTPYLCYLCANLLLWNLWLYSNCWISHHTYHRSCRHSTSAALLETTLWWLLALETVTRTLSLVFSAWRPDDND